MNNDNRLEPEPLMTAAEVAAAFRVDEKTAIKWAREGKIDAFKTPGGGWRFPETVVRAALNGGRP